MKYIYIFLLLLFYPVFVLAQDSSSLEKTDPQDVFRFGAEVETLTPIERDFIGAGGSINISEDVFGDVFVAGGTIYSSADIGGDFMALANKVVIDSEIAGNASIMAQEVEIRRGAKIYGDARIYAKRFTMNGTIEKSAKIDSEIFEQNGVIVGDTEYNKIEKRNSNGHFGWFLWLIGLFGSLVVGMVFVSVFPKQISRFVSSSMKNPFKDILWGLGAFVATPLVAIVLFLTVIGIPMALIVLLFYAAALYLGRIFVGIILGMYIFGAFSGEVDAKKFSLIWTMSAGVVALSFVCKVPVIGGIIGFLSLVWGLGIIVRIKMNFIKKIEE